MNDNVKKMRNGEKIKCPKCEDGYFSAVGDPQKPNVFRCDVCEAAIVLTPTYTLEDGIRILKNKEGKK